MVGAVGMEIAHRRGYYEKLASLFVRYRAFAIEFALRIFSVMSKPGRGD
jgi:hypothetical protein